MNQKFDKIISKTRMSILNMYKKEIDAKREELQESNLDPFIIYCRIQKLVNELNSSNPLMPIMNFEISELYYEDKLKGYEYFKSYIAHIESANSIEEIKNRMVALDNLLNEEATMEIRVNVRNLDINKDIKMKKN